MQNAAWEEGITAVLSLSYWELHYNMGILCWVICVMTPIHLYYLSNSNAVDVIQESLFCFCFCFLSKGLEGHKLKKLSTLYITLLANCVSNLLHGNY